EHRLRAEAFEMAPAAHLLAVHQVPLEQPLAMLDRARVHVREEVPRIDAPESGHLVLDHLQLEGAIVAALPSRARVTADHRALQDASAEAARITDNVAALDLVLALDQVVRDLFLHFARAAAGLVEPRLEFEMHAPR